MVISWHKTVHVLSYLTGTCWREVGWIEVSCTDRALNSDQVGLVITPSGETVTLTSRYRNGVCSRSPVGYQIYYGLMVSY